MILFRLHGGYNMSGFAQAAAVGTWVPESGLCPECGVPYRKLVQPLVIEWLKDSDVVADFTSAGLVGLVVTERVVNGLQRAGFREFEPGPVEMVEDPKVPKRAKIVRLPYQGPPLFDLWVTAWVHADLARSSAVLKQDCPECGVKRWELEGIEKVRSGYDRERRELFELHTPRTGGKGALILEAGLKGIDIFRIVEFPSWVCCTERVRDFVQEEGYTNAVFCEIGETITE